MFSRLCFVASWSNGLWRQEREVPVERVLESTIVQVVLPGHRPRIRTCSLVPYTGFLSESLLFSQGIENK
jgi:hypothetical protein